jgi:hypothetical protein
MRTFPGRSQRLTRSHFDFLQNRSSARFISVDLKRRPPKSRPAAPFVEDKLQLKGSGPQDSAVHVSLSSDSPVKQPGTSRPRPPPFAPPLAGEGRQGKPPKPAHPTWPQDHGRMLVHRLDSEGLRRRAIAPKRRRAIGSYIGFHRQHCQRLRCRICPANRRQSGNCCRVRSRRGHAQRMTFSAIRGPCAALRPHSSAVLA